MADSVNPRRSPNSRVCRFLPRIQTLCCKSRQHQVGVFAMQQQIALSFNLSPLRPWAPRRTAVQFPQTEPSPLSVWKAFEIRLRLLASVSERLVKQSTKALGTEFSRPSRRGGICRPFLRVIDRRFDHRSLSLAASDKRHQLWKHGFLLRIAHRNTTLSPRLYDLPPT